MPLMYIHDFIVVVLLKHNIGHYDDQTTRVEVRTDNYCKCPKAFEIRNSNNTRKRKF